MRHPPGTLRIIGGQWRRRIIAFPDKLSIRPTPDRIRETLFNWLMHDIQSARCLDCFSGSGILGFEALSRGAEHVVMCDRTSDIITHLRHTAESLECLAQITLQKINWSPTNTIKEQQPFDIIFLDPPFRQGYLMTLCHWLNQNCLIAPKGLIYMEYEKELALNDLPDTWHQRHKKAAGQVSYGLWQYLPTCQRKN